jgi:hypothetical protein
MPLSFGGLEMISDAASGFVHPFGFSGPRGVTDEPNAVF